MNMYKIKPGEVLVGSSSLYKSGKKIEKTEYLIQNMAQNKIISYFVGKGKTRESVLKEQISRYLKYRMDWKEQPKKCMIIFCIFGKEIRPLILLTIHYIIINMIKMRIKSPHTANIYQKLMTIKKRRKFLLYTIFKA